MIFHRDIRQGDALFGLGSLADIRQVQIILRRNGPAESENRETKSKWLKRECFHNLGDYPSQIFGTLLPDNCFSLDFTRQRKSRGELPLDMFLDSPRLATLRHRRLSRLCWRCAETLE